MASQLDNFLAQLDLERLQRVNGWIVKRSVDNPDIVLFTVRAKDDNEYIARCEGAGYPDVAPSVVFVNGEGSKTEPKAWPAGTPLFGQIVHPPPECFICTSLIREGLAHHPDWKTDASKDPWNPSKHTLMDVFNLLTRLLTGPEYTGRRTG